MLELSTVPDAQHSGGAGLECHPGSAQTFAQLIAVTTVLLGKRSVESRGLWDLVPKAGPFTKEPELTGRQGPKCWPASLGIKEGQSSENGERHVGQSGWRRASWKRLELNGMKSTWGREGRRIWSSVSPTMPHVE